MADRGLGVYERTRDGLLARMTELALTRGRDFTTLSFHDTTNHTTRRDGAVNVPRPETDLLPDVVALSNRGDRESNPRGDNPVTIGDEATTELMEAGVDWPIAAPDRIDRLAHACKASSDLYRAM
ncbi:hypothetical protein C8K36_101617 [Rhodococcus sp. OK519]|uniref:hypothetical protein n=1 Tax=Rhodococcus sp. OK519 TaxID=2135729 RepID=UPI000D4BF270|nr:hypothetical protein C8K36_101617 [Rhodococcus sp. OK519]